MKKETQIDFVKRIILTHGFITNFFAIENHILRLGAIVCELRKDGMDITSAYGAHVGGSNPKHKKNYYYMMTKYVTKNGNSYSFKK
jgi:hypothetical protein